MAKRENISVVTSEIFKNDPATQVANLKVYDYICDPLIEEDFFIEILLILCLRK